MAKDEVLYGYALLDDSEHTVSIDDIDRAFTRLHKFYCPHCHNEMYATFGEIQLSHFRHNGDKCQHRKYLHDLAEHIFYEEYSKCLDRGLPFYLDLRIPVPCNNACVLKKHADCKEHYVQKTVDLTKEYTLISIETRVDVDDRYRRPDVLLESFDGKQLWVEIWVSHETEEDKRSDGRIIELKIDTETDLEKIRKHRIVQSDGEDLAVRLFNIETDETDALFTNDIADILPNLPCEKYFYFEVGKSGMKTEVTDNIITTISTDLYYRIILRLNWSARHDTNTGHTGNKVAEKDLRSACLQKYYSYGENPASFRNTSFDSLIVSEWKPVSFKPTQISYGNSSRNSYHERQVRPQPQPTSESSLIEDMEWIDLGLPSGTLWAKEDVDDKTNFFGARNTYGSYVPSKEDADELRECCSKRWDDCAHELVLTGPNGNSISFPCKESNKSYWLNAYEQGDVQFGQCFHIGPDGHFWINDKESYSAIYIRLVSRTA